MHEHSASIRVNNLRTEYLHNPIGLDDPRPRFSWKLQPAIGCQTERGLAQSAYQIKVALDADGEQIAWDTGKVASGATSFIEYNGAPLSSGERAWWSVQVWDQADRPAPKSDPVFWEAGLLNPKDWKATWIASHLAGGLQTQVPVPFFRRTFHVAKTHKFVSARLYCTALGIYEFHINGQKVGKDVFAPFWTDYRQRVQYQAYDVTDLIRPGSDNAIGAILGDGWYCGYTGNIKRRQYYGDRPALLGQLHLHFSDGSSKIIATDGTWSTATGPILESDFFMGEVFDARLEMTGWDLPGFKADSRWTPAMEMNPPAAAIVGMTGPAVRAIQEIVPVSMAVRGTGETQKHILDMGQNMVGRVRLRVAGPAGAMVKMQFVEVLDDRGLPYTANLRSARQSDSYTLRGDPDGEIYESHFTFHGFRFIAIEGYPSELTLDAITGIVLHSMIEPTGTFECSDPQVNQLQKNIQWGQRGNFLDVPTDCPQRDERLGWTGDAQVFVRTAAFNFDVSGFFAKWTQDLRDSQSEKGEYPPFAPNNSTQSSGALGYDGGPAWADAGIICPWTMYLCYGDRRLLERHYESMVRFLNSLENESRPFGLIRSHPNWKGWHGFGDWLSQDGKNVFGATPKDLIGTAFFAYDAGLLSQIATVLGKREDASRFAKLREEVATAFCRRFVTDEGLIIGHTQTAYVLALHFDLLPETLRSAAIENLVRNIRENGHRLNTGFIGSPYLNHVLTRGGQIDVAFQLLMQKEWPSWLYAVNHGATTIWERWDGWTHDKGFQDSGMNSFNHYAYGAIGDWLYQVVAGIEVDPARPGYNHVLLCPVINKNGPLKYARATLETIAGRIESGWEIESERVKYSVYLPPNVTATLTIHANSDSITLYNEPILAVTGISVDACEPDRCEIILTSGRYDFSYVLSDGYRVTENGSA